jgi:hypothetical protein
VGLASFQAFDALVEIERVFQAVDACIRGVDTGSQAFDAGRHFVEARIPDFCLGLDLFVDGIEADVHGDEPGVDGAKFGRQEILKHFLHVFDYGKSDLKRRSRARQESQLP